MDGLADIHVCGVTCLLPALDVWCGSPGNRINLFSVADRAQQFTANRLELLSVFRTKRCPCKASKCVNLSLFAKLSRRAPALCQRVFSLL